MALHATRERLEMKFKIAIVALAVLTYARPSAGMDWKPIAAVTFGESLDAASTLRFLSNGSGCVESNRFIGTHPSALTVISQKAAVVVGSALFVKVTGRSTSKPVRVIGKVFAYALGATSARSGLRNISLCGL